MFLLVLVRSDLSLMAVRMFFTSDFSGIRFDELEPPRLKNLLFYIPAFVAVLAVSCCCCFVV